MFDRMNVFRIGLKRQKREVARMRILTCLAVFFLAVMLLLQDNIGGLRMELNFRNYGRWFACATDGFFDEYSYLDKSGVVISGSSIYLSHPRVYEYDGSFENDLAPEKNENGEKVKPPVTDENGEFLPPEPEIVVEDLGRCRYIEGNIGVLPDGFAENNGIELYDGRFPEAEGEIAMDLTTLRSLGLSYELGQEVVFYVSGKEPLLPQKRTYDGNGEIHYDEEDLYLPLKLVSFTLVGTIQRYTARWNGGRFMPSAIITKSAFDSTGSYKKEIAFYDLAGGVGGENVWEFASAQFEKFRLKEIDYTEEFQNINTNGDPIEIHCWNSAAYESPLWGSARFFRYITIFLAVISACMLAYLMAAYLGKRRKFFMRMREIGASSAEVMWLAAYECIISTLPFALLAAAAAFGAAAGASFLLKNSLGTKQFFVIKISTVRLMMICILLMLAGAFVAAAILFTGRGITQKKTRLGKGAERALARRAARKGGKAYLGLSESLKRERRIHPVKTFLVRAVTVLVSALMLFSLAMAYSSWYAYARRMNGGHDFTGWYHQNVRRNVFEDDVDVPPYRMPMGGEKDHDKSYAYTENFWNTSETLSTKFLEDLKQLSGIKSFTYATYDNTHVLEWEGKENDPFISYCVDEALHGIEVTEHQKLRYDGKRLGYMRSCADATLYRLLCFEDTKTLWKNARPYLDKSVANYSDFVSGRQVLIVVDTETYAFLKIYVDWMNSTLADVAKECENKWEALGHSFEPGDTVTIKTTAVEGSDTEAVIAGIIPASEYTKIACGSGEQINNRVPPVAESSYGVMMAVGSSGLAERVMVNDGGEFGFNVFGAKYSSIASSENAAKSLSALCVRYGMTYTDLTEDTLELRSDFTDAVLTYGFFFLVLFVLFMFIMGCAAREDRIGLAPKAGALHRAGTGVSSLKKQKSADAAKQSAWVLLSVPVFLLLYGLYNMKYHQPIGEKTFLTMLTSYFRSVRDSAMEVVKWSLPGVLIMLLILVVLMWLLNRKLEMNDELPERSK